jgi:uncharacterized membrane-anchored protein YitT (DUF2179 family)
MRSIAWRNIIGIVIGAAIMGFGINAFNLANNLAEGGITGISILLKLMFDLDPGLTILIINIPLFILGAKVLGFKSLTYTIIGTVCLSFFLWVFGKYRFPMDDSLLASLFAGVGVGTGLGIIFRYGGTTGGVDILAQIAKKYLGWKIGRSMFIADVAVLIISLVHLSVQQVMYTLVAVFVGTRLIDFVQEAAYSARSVLIVSDQSPAIAKDILEHLGRGVTILQGAGAYTNQARPVLFVVVGRSEIVKLKSLILTRDPSAFLSISEANEVMGQGFTLDAQHRPLTT